MLPQGVEVFQDPPGLLQGVREDLPERLVFRLEGQESPDALE
jgi:hypothetical protein